MTKDICRIGAVAAALALPGTALAQEAAAVQPDPAQVAKTDPGPAPATADAGLEDIVVTAQKREESLQRVPISIVSLNTAKLQVLNIKQFTEIGFQVPNLRLSQHPTTPFATRIFIRGIGNNDAQITQDPAVGVYEDGVYVARSTGLAFDFGDIERLEILRGPQGTLYGRNTIGGAINIVTRRPGGEFLTSGELTYGSKNLLRGLAHVELPRIGGVAMSLSALYTQRDGLVRNTGIGKDFGEYDRFGLRFAAEADVTDTVNAYLTYDHSVDHTTPYYYQADSVAAGPPFYYDTFIPAAPKRVKSASLAAPVQDTRLRIDGGALTLAWTPSDAITVKSITGYRSFRSSVYADFSANPVATLFQTNRQITDHHQFSEELQLLGSLFTDKLQYIVGAYYFAEQADQPERYTAGAFVINQHLVTANNKAQAAFANLTYAFTDALKLTVGGRYSLDQRRGRKDNVDFTIPDADGAYPSTFFARGSRHFHKFNPSANLSWQPSEDVNLYGKVVTGYRAGGFGSGAATRADFERGFNAENLTSYEAGVKLRGFDRRVQLNTAFFYSKYKDTLIDISVFGAPQFVASFNAGRARIYGTEIDLTVLPTPSTRLNLSYAYLNAKYTSVIDPQTGTDVTGQFKFADAPKNSFSLSADQKLGTIGASPLDLNVNYAWQGRVITTASYIQRPGARIGAYGLLGGRLTLSDVAIGATKFQLALWARNLANKAYIVDDFGSLPWTPKLKAYGEPRTLGVDLSFKL